MLFANSKFRLIACSVFYGLFALATVIMFIMGCVSMDWANSFDLMHIVVAIAILAVPYFLYLHADQIENGAGRFATGLIGQILLWGLTLFVLLLSFLNGGSRWATLCISSLLSTTISLAVFNLRAGLSLGSEKLSILPKDVDDSDVICNICYFIAFAAPFVSYPIAIALTLLPIKIAAMVWGAVFICSFAFVLMSDMLVSKIIGAAATLGIVITSIVFGCDKNLYLANHPANTLVLTPCLALLIAAALIAIFFKYGNDNPVVMFASLGVAIVATPFLQWLIGVKWFIGLPLVVVLCLAAFLLSKLLDGSVGGSSHSHSYSSGSSRSSSYSSSKSSSSSSYSSGSSGDTRRNGGGELSYQLNRIANNLSGEHSLSYYSKVNFDVSCSLVGRTIIFKINSNVTYGDGVTDNAKVETLRYEVQSACDSLCDRLASEAESCVNRLRETYKDYDGEYSVEFRS